MADAFADDMEQIRRVRTALALQDYNALSRLSQTQNLLPSSLSLPTLGVKRSLILYDQIAIGYT